MTILRPHGDCVEGQAENVDRGERSDERVGVGERMGDRVHLAVVMTALPDHRVGVAGGSDSGGLEQPLQESEQVAAVGFGSGNVHQIEHA